MEMLFYIFIDYEDNTYLYCLGLWLQAIETMWINFSKTVQFVSFLWAGMWRHRVKLVLRKTATRDPCVFLLTMCFTFSRNVFNVVEKYMYKNIHTYRNFIYIHTWTSLVAQMVKNLPAVWETWVQSLGWEDPLEKGMATHFNIFAMAEEPGGL